MWDAFKKVKRLAVELNDGLGAAHFFERQKTFFATVAAAFVAAEGQFHTAARAE
jgi:hypothetical protein